MDSLKNIAKIINSMKVKDVKIYQTGHLTPFYDYAIVMTALSGRMLASVIDHLRQAEGEGLISIRGVEGKQSGTWVLADLGDVIVHVFSAEERERYDLDKLWKDLPQTDLAELI